MRSTLSCERAAARALEAAPLPRYGSAFWAWRLPHVQLSASRVHHCLIHHRVAHRHRVRAQDQLNSEVVAKEAAQKESEQLRTQYKSLEHSFDELMEKNMQLKGGHKPTDKKNT
jgi:hypothetical protein